jgi:hypothetical protein
MSKLKGFSVFDPEHPPIHQCYEQKDSTDVLKNHPESIARRSAEISLAKQKLSSIIHPERKKKGPRSGTKRKMISGVFTDAAHWEVMKVKISRRCICSTDSPIVYLRLIENHSCRPLFSIPTLFSAHRATQLRSNSISKDEAHEDYVFRIELYALRAVFTDLQLMEEKFNPTHST